MSSILRLVTPFSAVLIPSRASAKSRLRSIDMYEKLMQINFSYDIPWYMFSYFKAGDCHHDVVARSEDDETWKKSQQFRGVSPAQMFRLKLITFFLAARDWQEATNVMRVFCGRVD